MRAFARYLVRGDTVLAWGQWRTVSTVSEGAEDRIHFRTDVGTADEAHFASYRVTPWFVKDAES